MNNSLYRLRKPVCAVSTQNAYEQDNLFLCGCSWNIQVRNLVVELIDEPRKICKADGGEILVTIEVAKELEKKQPIGMYIQLAEVHWYNYQEVSYMGPEPSLLQIRTRDTIHAALQSIGYGKCPHHPDRIIEPLVLRNPTHWSEYGFWIVEESGGIMVFTKAVRDLFISFDPDIEFLEVPFAD